MVTVALLIIFCCISIAGGVVIAGLGKFPLKGDRIVTGRFAQLIGATFALPGIVGLFGLLFVSPLPKNPLQYQQNISAIVSFVSFLEIVILINAHFTVKRHAGEVGKAKRQPLEDVLTVSEAARYLKVEEVYVLHLIEDGELKAKAIGGDYRISREALRAYLNA